MEIAEHTEKEKEREREGERVYERERETETDSSVIMRHARNKYNLASLGFALIMYIYVGVGAQRICVPLWFVDIDSTATTGYCATIYACVHMERDSRLSCG